MTTSEPIHFYSVSDEYGAFSNFAPYPITLRGKRWPTTEHFFQAQKFAAPRDQEEIRAANTPMIAARLGRDRTKKLRRDWERVKTGIMREAVEAKFRQHPELAELLRSTGRGRNELGKILMAVRAALAA